MEKEANKKPLSPIVNIFNKYNLVMFIVIVAVGLAIAVLDLNYILQLPYIATDNATGNSTITFDQTTITRLEKLKTSNENLSEQTFPSGRINPFAE